MKISHISFSTFGGAGKVAQELHNYQKKVGLDSTLDCISTLNVRKEPFKHPKLTFFSALDKYLISKYDNPSMISILRNLHDHSDHLIHKNEYDVIHLHWLPGILSLQNLNNLYKSKTNFVWSIQDFWPITGGCHFMGTCNGFVKDCSDCPQIRTGFKSLAKKQLKNKMVILDKFEKNLTLVAPSIFVAKKIKLSPFFSKFNSVVIGNPIQISDSPSNLSKEFASDRDVNRKFIIGCVAADLSEKRKNISLLVNWFLKNCTDSNSNYQLLLIGNNGGFIPKHPRIKIVSNVNDPKLMTNLYLKMDVNVSLSLEETFGYSILESGLQKVPSICFENTAQSELIQNNLDGFVLSHIGELKIVLDNLAANPERIKQAGVNILKKLTNKYHVSNINSEYMKIYSE